MGSGHFLVTAVDFLSDYIAELIEHTFPTVPEWLDGDESNTRLPCSHASSTYREQRLLTVRAGKEPLEVDS